LLGFLLRQHAGSLDRGLGAPGGSRPAMPTYFSCFAKKSRQKKATPLPPSLRLRLRATCAVKLLRLCGPTHFAASRFAQTHGRRFDDDAAALCGAAARRKSLPSQAWAQGVRPTTGFVPILAGRPYLPVCLRLRHGVRDAGNAAAGQRCIVNWLAAVCLSEAACRAASWAAAQLEWRDAGLPAAKRRDVDGREAFFAYFLTRQKVSRPPGRKPGVAGKVSVVGDKSASCFDSYCLAASGKVLAKLCES